MVKLFDKGRAPFTTSPSPLIPVRNPGEMPGKNRGSEPNIVRPDGVAIVGKLSICLEEMEYFIVASLASTADGVALTSITSFAPLGVSVSESAEFMLDCSTSPLTRMVPNPDISIRRVYVPG